MAKIIGGITTSHIPAIGVAMDKQLEETPYFRDLFAIYPPIREWLGEEKPDIAVLFYNDHGLEMWLDKKPTFAIGCAPEYQNADEGWGIKPIPPVTGETELSWHIVNHLIENDFDPTVCQDIKVDHGATVPLTLLWPNFTYQGIKVIPISINCERHPMPKPSRSYAFGQAIGDAIRCWDSEQKVVVLGTGGLSHQLDGPRAGILNADFDNWCMDKLVSNPEEILQFSNVDLIERGGAQMVELAMWLAMRGCIKGEVEEKLRNYVSPISNTAVGVQLLLPKEA
ncbi:class III extradiol dioxygenase family protein [Parathalassolituus penaei]|uniref:Class III extradiol dioxygenase family protein n=1 Tax=Parathalassolituus penaei TaxID=2997323 RepID=A0A9X3EJM9_9GAMM|nr:class III extradiol dioxygenase family protein [Parathalassolituus penaei]MCY0965521.1 class III extradiol dioxygenase family protein [Parathalassolituus penaei]